MYSKKVKNFNKLNKFIFSNFDKKFFFLNKIFFSLGSFFLVPKQGGLHFFFKKTKFNSESFLNFFNFLKLNYFFKYEQLLDIVCIDLIKFKANSRLELVYNCLNILNNSRIFVHIFVELLVAVPSLTKIYKSSE